MTDRRQLAVQTDTEIVAAYGGIADAMQQMEALYGRLKYLQDGVAVGAMRQRVAEQIAEIETTLNTLRDTRDQLWERLNALQAIWYADPWPRFFLVLNTNGHIHKTMECQTCFADTKFAWLPELAALTEEEAVAQEGAILCTICFPTAPVEWTNGVGTRQRLAADERERIKAERLAKKKAKWLTDEERGIKVTVTTPAGPEDKRLRTLNDGKGWLVEQAARTRWNIADQYRPDMQQVMMVAGLVAAKEGGTAEEVWENALAKDRKRRR